MHFGLDKPTLGGQLFEVTLRDGITIRGEAGVTVDVAEIEHGTFFDQELASVLGAEGSLTFRFGDLDVALEGALEPGGAWNIGVKITLARF